ncbi:cation acetate symporter [Streptomyces sp. NPDC005476]|uniref:sodium:solute symporter family transporter n=1 Tax=Streptomyces sp. NPDC005476 TaxID=3156882 RepID=UPI0034520C5C
MVLEAAAPVFIGRDASQVLVIGFLIFLVGTLFFSLTADPEGDLVSAYYRGGRQMGTLRNALALSSECVPAGTILGTTGTIAVSGYDGLVVTLSLLLSLGILLLFASTMRSHGRFTVGDLLARRAEGPAIRIAGAVVTLSVCVLLLTFEIAGVGVSTALLFGFSGVGAQQVLSLMIGSLIICASAFGGMRGASALHILKAVVFGAASLITVALVLSHFHWSADAVISAARKSSSFPDRFLGQGMSAVPGASATTAGLDFIGLQLTIVFGVAFMPHIVMRINTTADGPSAQRVVRHAITITAAFCLLAAIMGLGAAAIVGSRTIAAADPGGTSALLRLASHLAGGPATGGGAWFFVLVACAVFAAVLAASASFTLSAAAAVAHDIRSHKKRARPDQGTEVLAARWAGVGIGSLSMALAVAVQGWNIQFLTMLAMAIAASAVLPALIYSIFWTGYTRTGLLWTLYGGLAGALVLQLSSPAFSGTAFALFPHWHINWYPLQTVAPISIPAGFLLGWTGSLVSRNADQ